MIDFLRMTWRDKTLLEKEVCDSTNHLDLSQQILPKSGVIEDYPKIVDLYGMELRITDKRAFLLKSIHKMYNSWKKGENQNFDDFSYSKLSESIKFLNENIPDIRSAHTTQLEFGFNIVTPETGEEIANKALLFKKKGPILLKDFKGKGAFRQFDGYDYSLKVYDKAKQYKKQYNLEDNILRVELRFNNNKQLRALGVFGINDLLNRTVISDLFEYYKNHLNDLIILDSANYEALMTPQDHAKFIEFRDSRYWSIYARNQYSDSTRDRNWNEFMTILSKYNLNTTKAEILELIDQKYKYLISN